MQTKIIAAIALAACQDEGIEPDDVARVVGMTLATPEDGALMGALADSRTIASGGVPDGFAIVDGAVVGKHADIDHRYHVVACRDASDALVACGPTTVTATIVSSWLGDSTWRTGTWTLTELQGASPRTHGESRFVITADGYTIVATQTEVMLGAGSMMGGGIIMQLDVTRGHDRAAMTARVHFVSKHARIVLDDELIYGVELASGQLQ